ncbi:MAG: glycosyltransferase family 4 protein [Deltaproteobacteria bacterium]|nr:glycosyltransferase family 4 protein [Deltaproteobacteria bacterium]
MENKILIVSFECVPDASYTSTKILMLTDCLTRAFNVDVLTLKYEGLAHLEKWLGARIYRVPVENMNLKERISTFRRALSRQLEGGMYDVIHFTDPFGGLIASNLREDYGFNTVYDIYSLSSWELKFSGLSQSLYNQIKEEEDICLDKTDRILVPSLKMMEYFEQRGYGDKTRYIPGVVKLRKKEEHKREDTFNVLYIGSFSGWEDIDTFFKAVKKIKKSCNIQVNVVGFTNPEKLGDIVTKLQKMGIDDVFRFEGPRYGSELDTIYKNTDAAVVPIGDFNRNVIGGVIPLKLLDIMSASVPVVAAGTPAIESTFKNGEEILLYNFNDADMLATHLLALAEHPSLCELIGKNSRKKIEAEYSGEPWRKRMLVYYSELLDINLENISVAGEWEESETREMIVKELQHVVSRQRETTTSTTNRKAKKRSLSSQTSTKSKKIKIDSSAEDTFRIKR